MKRIIPLCLALLLTLSLVCVPASAADSGEDGSGSMVLNWVDQTLTGLTETTVEDGYIVLGENMYPESFFPASIRSKYKYWVLDGSKLYGSDTPFVVYLNATAGIRGTHWISVGSTAKVPVGYYWLYTDGTVPYSYGEEMVSYGSTIWRSYATSIAGYEWSNQDLIYYSSFSGLYPELNGELFAEGSPPVLSGSPVLGEGSFSYTGSINSFRLENAVALGSGVQKGDSISSDLTYSFSAMDSYVDINLPLSMWSDSVPANYDGITIDGDVLLDFALGLTLWLEDFSAGKYIISDLVPSTFQLLINGALCDDTTQYSFAESARASAGSVFSDYQSPGLVESASISTGEIAVDQIDTLGFRIYLSSASGGAAKTFTNDSTFSLSWPYVYANFVQSDGSIGLPAVTFSEVEVVDPDPEPSVSPNPDPEPSVSPDPDPEPSVSPDPDPEPSVSPDPDPEPSESYVPTVPPEMEILGDVITETLPFFQREFSVFGFTFSFWELMLFGLIADVVIYLIWRFLR